MLLKDKVVLVTGSSRGIGATLAKGFAREGAKVVVNYSSSRERGEEVLEEVKRTSPDSIILGFDVSDNSQVEQAVETIIDRFGRIDVLVNNAGILKGDEFLKVKEEDIDSIFSVNVKGSVFCMQRVAAHMKKNAGGSIINISSISQFSPFLNSIPYALSKSAIQMLTRVGALELGRYNIRVNTLIPGIIKTEIDERYNDETLMGRMQRIIPLNRIGSTSDMVGAAVFLASDMSAYITGIEILVDGGFVLFKDKNPEK